MGAVAKWYRSVSRVVHRYVKRRHRNRRQERNPDPNFVARRNKREWKRACYYFRVFLGIAFFVLVVSWVQSLYDAGSLSYSVETGCQGGAGTYQHEGSHAVISVQSLYDAGSLSHSVETGCQGGAGTYQHEGSHAVISGESVYDVGSISHSVETRCQGGTSAYQHEGAHAASAHLLLNSHSKYKCSVDQHEGALAVFPEAQDESRYLHPPKMLSRQIGGGKPVYGTVGHLVILDNISSQRSVYTKRKELIHKALDVGTLYSRMRLVSEKRGEIGVPVFYGNRSHSLVTRASDSGCAGKKTCSIFLSSGFICIHLCLDFHAVK